MKIKILLATVALTLFIGCGGASGTDPIEYVPYPYAPAISATDKQEFLDAVNNARATGRECGEYGYMEATTALTWDDRLYKAAYEHTNDMAQTGHLEHTGSGEESDWTAQVLDLDRGSLKQERAENNGLVSMGENIGWQTDKNLDTMMDWWLNSDGHCRNIMDPTHTIIGMAYVENQDASTTYKHFWTQEFY